MLNVEDCPFKKVQITFIGSEFELCACHCCYFNSNTKKVSFPIAWL